MSEVEEEARDTMSKKKDELREIPIKFADNRQDTILDDADDAGLESNQANGGSGVKQSGMSAEGAAPQESDASAGGSSESSSSQPEQTDPRASLQSQVDTLTQEKGLLYDQLLRRQAEFENFRKRSEREKSEYFQRTRAEVLLELLPVLDNFERAMASLEQGGADATSLRHGIELIHKQFRDAMTKLGLQPVASVGQTFDPHLHEAVTIEPTDEHEENTVIEEFQRGYKLGDRLLRPAKVKVASSPNR